jgi:hypothetical protein
MARSKIPAPELAADLERMTAQARAIHADLNNLLTERWLPDTALPNLTHARKSALNLATQLDASRQLTEAA